MKKAALAGAALMAASSATAGGFQIDVENFTASRGISEVVIKVTNQTGQDARNVFIDCVFMGENHRAIDIGKAMISTLQAGAATYEKAAIGQSDGILYVACEVKRFS